MAYSKHTWLARLGTGLNKFFNSGDAQHLVLTPEPDSVSQEGTPFSSQWMNEMEDGIYNAHSAISSLQNTVSGNSSAISSLSNIVAFNNAGAHNSIYRGKSLGTSVTAAQYAAIASGTFDDMYIGDYWTINGHKYVICDFDYFSARKSTHHVVLTRTNVSDYKAMYETSANNGYYGSDARAFLQNTTLPVVQADFGSAHIMQHEAGLITNVNSNGSAGSSFCDCSIELFNEIMLFGHEALGLRPEVINSGVVYGPMRQLSVCRYDPTVAASGYNEITWLRDVYDSSKFVYVANGAPYVADATYKRYLHYYFCLKG